MASLTIKHSELNGLSARSKSETTRDSVSSEPRRRLTQGERTAAMRCRLLDAATEYLAEAGFAAFKVEGVADLANVSRGAIHHHFGSRDGLLSAVVDDLGNRLLDPPQVATDGTIEELLDAAINRDWEVLGSVRFVAALQILVAVRSDDKLHQQIIRQVTEFEDKLDANWAEMLAGGKASKSEIMTLRHMVSATLRGLAIRSIYHGKTIQSSEEIAMLKSISLSRLK
jgi:AcrR family transcriptional regulator